MARAKAATAEPVAAPAIPIVRLEADTDETTNPPTLSVDVVCFETNGSVIHIGSANSQEMAIALADEYDLPAGQMIRVTPMVYFRVNHRE